jgi:hypothetical protein
VINVSGSACREGRGAANDVLAAVGDGTFVLRSADGFTYTFAADGTL